MFDWLASNIVTGAVIGAVVGILIGGLRYLYRDWQNLAFQWRYRRRMERGTDAYFEELRELEAYRPDAVTDEDRARLPGDLVRFAMIGIAIGVSIAS